jgi:hypothetical protein
MASQVRGGSKPPLFSMALLLGWLVPGAGHLLSRHPVRAALLFVCILGMFAAGLAMQGKIYQPNTDDPLGTLGFIGDLGSGLLYFVSNALGWGRSAAQTVTADYGKVFIVVAGLLNFTAAVDAHNLRIGRKAAL